MPQISLGTWAFIRGPYADNPWSLERVLDFAAEVGYDGVELSGYRPHAHYDDYDTPEKRQALREMVESRGLAVSGYAPDLRHVPAALTETEVYLPEILKAMQLCVGVRTDVLRVDTGVPPEELSAEEYSDRFRRIVLNWDKAAEEGLKIGVGLEWEFEPRFLVNKASEVRRLLEAMPERNLHVILDMSHAYMMTVVGARQPGIVQTLPYGIVSLGRDIDEYIGHLHLSDSDGTVSKRSASSKHVTLGQGKIDYDTDLYYLRERFKKLAWWTVDLNEHDHAEEAARESLAVARELLLTYGI
ncbi:MAG: sugar phosphate isomerase/epimerase family protein [Anaerolineae bacterium]|jgi:sugar phosphate isomerase/epimerase|nr:sugar phosphate isomerase/epimerase [Chloroflexota bacterium]